jgi:DNA-3-methyladenine glycosylase I
MPLLFSYGTLQQGDVQHAIFGRQLRGRRDALVGYRPAAVKIEDPAVASALGRTDHANVAATSNPNDRVAGTVFEVTEAELAMADAFEQPFAYARVAATLASGKEAWVYRHSPDTMATIQRCAWAQTPLSIEYHDREWGVPVHDDRTLFEFLTLEGAQAGLSWETILRKRAGYRAAFADFDAAAVARFTPARIERLLQNPAIIRNRLKVEGTVRNARAFRAVQKEFGSFDAYVWRFVGGATRVNQWTAMRALPARTEQSDALSRDLKRRGFTFVGSTICYAFMQAVGLVDDHTIGCFRRLSTAR